MKQKTKQCHLKYTTLKKMKRLCINLTKVFWDWYTKNSKILLKTQIIEGAYQAHGWNIEHSEDAKSP